VALAPHTGQVLRNPIIFSLWSPRNKLLNGFTRFPRQIGACHPNATAIPIGYFPPKKKLSALGSGRFAFLPMVQSVIS